MCGRYISSFVLEPIGFCVPMSRGSTWRGGEERVHHSAVEAAVSVVGRRRSGPGSALLKDAGNEQKKEGQR